MKKNFNMDRQFNEKELKNQVKNASSATERAKMLLKAGKLKVDQKKRFKNHYKTLRSKCFSSAGFKRRQSTGGGAKARPLQLDEPEFALPQYADDPVEFSVEDKYKNIPDSNEALPQAPMKPKPRPVQKVCRKILFISKYFFSRNHRRRSPQSNANKFATTTICFPKSVLLTKF